MKILILISIFTVSTTGFSRETKVQDLFRIMNMEHLQKESIDGMVDQQLQSTPQLRIVEDEYRSWMHDIAGWDAIKKPTAKIWKKHFNPREISDLIDFYKTPTGKKLLDKQPELMAFSVKLMNEKLRSKKFQKGVQRIIQLSKERAEALKTDTDTPPEE